MVGKHGSLDTPEVGSGAMPRRSKHLLPPITLTDRLVICVVANICQILHCLIYYCIRRHGQKPLRALYLCHSSSSCQTLEIFTLLINACSVTSPPSTSHFFSEHDTLPGTCCVHQDDLFEDCSLT